MTRTTRTKRTAHIATLGALVFALAGCASNSTSMAEENCTPPGEGDAVAAGSVNSICPIGGDGVGAGSPLVTHKGTTIALCCDGCVTKWNAMDESQRDEVRAKALANKA